MAKNLPTRTWVDPRSGKHDPELEVTLRDLSNWLARPTFYNSILVGDGTPPTRNAAGVWVQPSTLIDLHAKIVELEARIATLEAAP